MQILCYFLIRFKNERVKSSLVYFTKKYNKSLVLDNFSFVIKKHIVKNNGHPTYRGDYVDKKTTVGTR